MKKVIIIAGGGTGGHIYPALAIGEAIKKKDSQYEIHYIGSKDGLESKIIGRESYPLHLIKGGKLNMSGRWLDKIKTVILIPIGLIQSSFLILKLRPKFVLGVGGYASGPFVLMAALLRCKTALWEPNAYPGLANRILAGFVDQCFVVFEKAKSKLKNEKIMQCGMPIRKEPAAIHKDQIKDPDYFRILHFGGSQGSRIIGNILNQMILKYPEVKQKFKFVHQTGAVDFADFKKKYAGLEDTVEVVDFIYDMPKYYQWADLVLCRGGASTLTEIAAYSLSSIVVPLPAADGHQEHNALELSNAGAGMMVLQKDLNPDSLFERINQIYSDKNMQESFSRNVFKFYQPHSSERLAEIIIKLAGQ